MIFHHKFSKRPCFLKMSYLGPYTLFLQISHFTSNPPNSPVCSKTLYIKQSLSYNLIFSIPIFTPNPKNALIQFTKTLSFGQNSPNSLIFRVFRVNGTNDLFSQNARPPLASEFGPKFSWKLKPSLNCKFHFITCRFSQPEPKLRLLDLF